jgi:hypothetical protein
VDLTGQFYGIDNTSFIYHPRSRADPGLGMELEIRAALADGDSTLGLFSIGNQIDKNVSVCATL